MVEVKVLARFCYFVFFAYLLLVIPRMDSHAQIASEVVYYTTSATGELLWYSGPNQNVKQLGIFGQTGDLMDVGHWTNLDVKERVFVKKLPQGELRIFGENYPSGFTVDIVRDDSIVQIGKDFNKNGYCDMVVTLKKKRVWEWHVLLDPIAPLSPRFKIVKFGRVTDKPIYFRKRGKFDSVGVLKGRGKRSLTLRYRSLRSKRIKKIRLKTSDFTPSQFYVVKLGDKDGFVMGKPDSVAIFNNSGKLVSEAAKLVPRGSIHLISPAVNSASDVFQTLNGELRSLGMELKVIPIQSNAIIPLPYPSKEYLADELSPTPVSSNTNPQVSVPEPVIPTATPLISPTATPSASGNFNLETTFPLGDNASDLQIADLNNDGMNDIVVLSSSYLVVLNPDRNGSITVGATLPTSFNARSGHLALGDINGDSFPDILVSTRNTGVPTPLRMYLTNSSAQTFLSPQYLDVGSSENRDIEIADFDGDLRNDILLALSSSSGTKVRIYRNHADGTFPGWHDVVVGPRSVSVQTADLNGDGRLDFRVEGTFGGPIVTINNGSGAFSTSEQTSGESFSSKLFDLNSDGNRDVATFEESDLSLRIFHNNGIGVFTQAQSIALGYELSALDVGDIDNDGDYDIAVADSTTSRIVLFSNDGVGNFTVSQTLDLPGAPKFLQLGDFNADGIIDMVTVTEPDNVVRVLLGIAQ